MFSQQRTIMEAYFVLVAVEAGVRKVLMQKRAGARPFQALPWKHDGITARDDVLSIHKAFVGEDDDMVHRVHPANVRTNPPSADKTKEISAHVYFHEPTVNEDKLNEVVEKVKEVIGDGEYVWADMDDVKYEISSDYAKFSYGTLDVIKHCMHAECTLAGPRGGGGSVKIFSGYSCMKKAKTGN